MRKVDLSLAINYIIHRGNDTTFQVAWFNNLDDAEQFLGEMVSRERERERERERYEIAEVRR